MELKELLRSIPDDEYVYIGSQSGFVCICRCSEAKKQLKEKSKYYLDMYSEQKRIAEVGIEKHPKVMKKYRYMLSGAEKKNDISQIRKIKAQMLRAETEYKNKLRDLERLTGIVSRYKNFIDREVKDTYRRKFVEPLGVVILVEGVENGPYWSLDEVKEK